MKKENGVQIVNVHLFSKSKGKKNNLHLGNNSKTIPQEEESKFKLPSILNYENLLNKLLKFIKNTFPEPYLEIKNFLQNEIQQSIESSIKRNESQSSILNTIPQSKNTITIHPPNTINIKPKNEKKLKLSYDFSNLLTSPKPKPIKIEISNIKKVNNITITPSNTKTITKDNKDIHSLFTILKKDNQSNNKTQKQKPSKTQSNSKSKSKSTSRECSNNHYTNTNSNITNGNNLKKVTTVKQTLITKSQPLLNEKLFSKLNLKTNATHSKSKVKKKSFIKVKSNSSNKRTSSKCSVKNHSSNMKTIPKNSKSKKKKQNKTTMNTNIECNVHSNKESKVKSQYIDLSDVTSNNINVTKNEEMMKQIKNTLDDNLKVMFNFSYENFLSKESESESKKSSQQEIVLNEQNE